MPCEQASIGLPFLRPAESGGLDRLAVQFSGSRIFDQEEMNVINTLLDKVRILSHLKVQARDRKRPNETVPDKDVRSNKATTVADRKHGEDRRGAAFPQKGRIGAVHRVWPECVDRAVLNSLLIPIGMTTYIGTRKRYNVRRSAACEDDISHQA